MHASLKAARNFAGSGSSMRTFSFSESGRLGADSGGEAVKVDSLMTEALIEQVTSQSNG